MYLSLFHGALLVAQTSQGAGIALQDEMVENTAGHGGVPEVQGLLTAVQTKLRILVLSVDPGDGEQDYLGTNLGLHLVRLLCDSLLAEEVRHEVLGSSSALIAGDGTLGCSYSRDNKKEGLHTGLALARIISTEEQ